MVASVHGFLFVLSLGAFTRSGINHLLPVINVVGNTALARQKDPTDISEVKLCGPFAVVVGQHDHS